MKACAGARPDHAADWHELVLKGQIGTIASRMRPSQPRPAPSDPLRDGMPADRASLLVRGDVRPFTLTGAWASGGALVGSSRSSWRTLRTTRSRCSTHSPRSGRRRAEAVGGGLVRLPRLRVGRPARAGAAAATAARTASRLRARVLRPPAAARPGGALVVRGALDQGRDAALHERRERLAGRLAAGVRERQLWVGGFRTSPPGSAGHVAAVEACRADRGR